MNPRPTSKPLTAPKEQTADFVELFFDLVFVFAITRITHLTAHHLDLTTVLRSVLVFWMIWWGWTQMMWALNAANTERGEIRVATLVATAVAFAMAASTAQAFDKGVLLFAVSYNLVRVFGIGLYLRIVWADVKARKATLIYALTSLMAVTAVMVGAFALESARVWWWLIAIGLDMLAGYLSGRVPGLQLRAAHFSERHGLIVIIALGESLIVAGAAVADDERTASLMYAGAFAVVVTCLLWWTYFGWVRKYLEERLEKSEEHVRVIAGRDAFTFGHFPLVCGVVSLAVAFEGILSHPAEALGAEFAAALALGVVLFIETTAAAVWRVTGIVLWPRIGIVLGTGAALFFAVGHPPAIGLSIAAAVRVERTLSSGTVSS